MKWTEVWPRAGHILDHMSISICMILHFGLPAPSLFERAAHERPCLLLSDAFPVHSSLLKVSWWLWLQRLSTTNCCVMHLLYPWDHSSSGARDRNGEDSSCFYLRLCLSLTFLLEVQLLSLPLWLLTASSAYCKIQLQHCSCLYQQLFLWDNYTDLHNGF